MSFELLTIFCLIISAQSLAPQDFMEPTVNDICNLNLWSCLCHFFFISLSSQDSTVREKFFEFNFVYVPMIILLFFFMIILFLWLVCWLCDDWAEDEPRLETQRRAVPRATRAPIPPMVNNVNDQHLVCIQNVSQDDSSHHNAKEVQKSFPRSFWSRVKPSTGAETKASLPQKEFLVEPSKLNTDEVQYRESQKFQRSPRKKMWSQMTEEKPSQESIGKNHSKRASNDVKNERHLEPSDGFESIPLDGQRDGDQKPMITQKLPSVWNVFSRLSDKDWTKFSVIIIYWALVLRNFSSHQRYNKIIVFSVFRLNFSNRQIKWFNFSKVLSFENSRSFEITEWNEKTFKFEQLFWNCFGTLFEQSLRFCL